MYQRQVVLYTRERSLRCWRARRLLDRAGYRYKVVDVTDDPGMLTEISNAVHHEVALPYVFVDDRPLGALGTLKSMVGSGTFEHVLRDDL